jgi:hypothetical protein
MVAIGRDLNRVQNRVIGGVVQIVRIGWVHA